jgi:hypothetical protein
MDGRRKVWDAGESFCDSGIFGEIGNMKNGRVQLGGYGFADLENTFMEERDI